MKNYTNRHDKNYHAIRLSSIHELDKIASYVLAINWSRRRAQTAASQGLIQMDCVAACYVNGELWIASNSQELTSADIEALQAELGDVIVYIVTNGTPQVMHAEMQLLSQLIQENVSTAGMYMGVSKPCCDYCRHELNKAGINYTQYHTANVKNWESPW